MTVQLALDCYFGTWYLTHTSLRHISRYHVLGINLNGVQTTKICPKKGQIWVTRYAGSKGCPIPSLPVHCDANKNSALSARGRISNERWLANWRCQRLVMIANCSARNMPCTVVEGQVQKRREISEQFPRHVTCTRIWIFHFQTSEPTEELFSHVHYDMFTMKSFSMIGPSVNWVVQSPSGHSTPSWTKCRVRINFPLAICSLQLKDGAHQRSIDSRSKDTNIYVFTLTHMFHWRTHASYE